MVKKSNKSIFTNTQNFTLLSDEQKYYERVISVLNNHSQSEIVGSISGNLSDDGKERPLVLSREIVNKIQGDHGSILPNNFLANVHRWEYATTCVNGNPDKINLIKEIPGSNNYFLIAANRYNGYYIVTHFETEAHNPKNLKRLLKRGNVYKRVLSNACTTNQGDEPTRESV